MKTKHMILAGWLALSLTLIPLSVSNAVGEPSSCVPAPSGLVSWWKGDSNLQDSVGDKPVTLQNGATFTSGKVGNGAFRFLGNGGFISTELDAQPSAMRETTWEAWVRPLRLTGRQQILSTDDDGFDRSVLIDGDKFTVFTGHGVWSPTEATENEWQHIAVVFEQNNIRFYRNGVESSLGSPPGGQETGQRLTFGARPVGDEFFKGSIDEISVYNRALSAREITTIFEAGSAGKCTPGDDVIPRPGGSAVLKHRYSFGERSGELSVTDSVSGANGVLKGGSTLTGEGWLRLDGEDGHVDLPNGIISALGDASFEAWVVVDEDRGWQRIFDFGNNTGGEDQQGGGLSYLFLTPLGGPGVVRFALNSGTGENPILDGAGKLGLGEETHLVATYSQGNNKARLYVKGELVDEKPTQVSLSVIEDINNWLGKSNWLDPYFKGSFNEFRIWEGALSAEEVARNSEAGADGVGAEPVPNKGPSITSIPNQLIEAGTATGVIAFTVSDAETVANNLVVTGSSSYTQLVSGPGITLGGSGANRTVTITPATGQTGASTILLRVTDEHGLSAETSFVLTVKAPTIVTPPQITEKPLPTSVTAGGRAAFFVKASGTGPLSYQWKHDGQAISFTGASSATSPNLQLYNVSAVHAGEYTVVVSNAGGKVESTGAFLTVQTQPPGGLPVSCTPLPPDLVGWWKSDSGPIDISGFKPGILQNGATLATSGKVGGGAFIFDGSDDFVSTELDAQPSALPETTWEAWIHPLRLTGRQQILSIDDNGFDRSILIDGDKFSVFTGVGVWSPSEAAVNEWQHIAVVFTPSDIHFYRNGVGTSLGSPPGGQETGQKLAFGARPVGDEFFKGLIDEVAVYHRALSAGEIKSIYEAGSAGKCLPGDNGAPPSVSSISDQLIEEGTATGAIGFTVSDAETVASNLMVTGNSSNMQLVLGAGISLDGSGANRTVMITPATGQTGISTITLQVTDEHGLSAEVSFVLTVNAAPTGAGGLTFTVGSAQGSKNAEVVVPVRVQNLGNIAGVQFSMHWDPNVASFVGTEQYGLPVLRPGNFGTRTTSAGTLTVSWDSGDGIGKTVADNTTIFAIRFRLIGNSGATSAVTIDGTPTAIEAFEPPATVVPVRVDPGQVQILSTLTLAGTITSPDRTKRVPGVQLNATGGATLSALTGTDGTYSLTLNTGGSYTVTPTKTDDSSENRGVSTADIGLIRRHILNITPLDSPYKVLAGDVNGTRAVTTADIGLLRRLILGMTNSLPAGIWRFVQSDYRFANPQSPWAAEESRNYLNLNASVTGQDFFGVKFGDVNNSWKPSGVAGSSAPRRGAIALRQLGAATAQSIRFQIDDRTVNPGETISVPISVAGFTDVTTVQFSVRWDSAVLEYVATGDYGVSGLGAGNFGADFTQGGTLTFSWDDPGAIGVTLADGSVLFSVTFKALGSNGISSAVELSDDPTAREVTVNFEAVELGGENGLITVGATVEPQQIAGDFSGDGFSDIIFQDDRGFLAVWRMNAADLDSAALLEPNNVGDLSFQIVGSGDFNGDSKQDLLFQRTDGTLAVWHMDGHRLIGGAFLTPNNPGDRNWRIVGTGDFNGDGNVDLVFQHKDGTLAVWRMDGIALASAALVDPSKPGDGWKAVGTGDFNSDGAVDLAFQNTDGTLAVWHLNGVKLTSGALLTPSSSGITWQVVSVADRNRDGKPDLLFRNTDNGTLAVWFMDGVKLDKPQLLKPSNPGGTWKVGAP